MPELCSRGKNYLYLLRLYTNMSLALEETFFLSSQAVCSISILKKTVWNKTVSLKTCSKVCGPWRIVYQQWIYTLCQNKIKLRETKMLQHLTQGKLEGIIKLDNCENYFNRQSIENVKNFKYITVNTFYASWRIAGNFMAKKLCDIEFLKNTNNVVFENIYSLFCLHLL